jgi:hypothetical protein
MKYKVVRNFIDLETGKKHLIDSEYEPSSAKRGKDLKNRGFLEEVAEKKQKKGEK